MTNMIIDESFIVETLKSLGTYETGHSGRTLGKHLFNTYKLLEKMKAPPDVCLAGAFHSIYGTNIFQKSTIDPKNRHKVKDLFSEKVENLIYLFSIINRPSCFETNVIQNYKTGETIDVDEETLYNLKFIEIANLIEQKSSISRFPVLLEMYKEILGNINKS